MAGFLSSSDRTVLSQLQDAVVFLDRSYRIVVASDRFFQWTGFSPTAVVGRPMAEFWEDPTRWSDWLTVGRLAGAPIEATSLDLKTSGGDPIPIEARLAFLAGWSRRRTPRVLVLQDLRNQRLLERLVREDPLTGVLSRSCLADRLTAELTRARSYGGTLGVLCADIDGMAALNRQWGLDFGDEVLRVAGAQLREVVPSHGVAGRWGSDEFLVALPQADRDGLLALAESLRSQFCRRLFVPEGIETVVTWSFGVALAVPTGHDTPASLTGRLSDAVGVAQSRGGNQIEFRD